MTIGFNVANTNDNKLTVTSGALWAVFGPCLPYVLLGCVLTGFIHFSNKKAIRPLTFTVIVLCVFTCIYHVYSQMILHLGERFNFIGMVESPNAFAIVYSIVGIIAIFAIAIKLGAIVTKD